LLASLRAWNVVSEFRATDDWMFASAVKYGKLPISYTGYKESLQRAAKAAGLGELATHSLRHTYRSWLDAVGTPVTVQQKLMRHSDIRTTLNVYADVVTDETQVAESKIARIALRQ
jgi:integrase